MAPRFWSVTGLCELPLLGVSTSEPEQCAASRVLGAGPGRVAGTGPPPISGFVVLWIDHHPMDDKGNDILPRACEHCRRGQIYTWENHLIQGKKGEIGLANLQDHAQLYQGNEIRSEQSGAVCLAKEPLELISILCSKL